MQWTHEHAEVLAAVIFVLAFAAHGVRVVQGWSLQLGPYSVPMWASWIAVLAAGYLTYHFWRKILTR